VVKVKNTHKPLVAIELGRAGLVLRGLAPVMDNGTYLGSVEFMQGLNSIVKHARKTAGYEMVILMKNQYLSVATLMGKAPKVGDYTLADNSPCVGTGQDGTNMGAYGVGCSTINLSPVIAALLMPISSISVVSFATFVTRFMGRNLK